MRVHPIDVLPSTLASSFEAREAGGKIWERNR